MQMADTACMGLAVAQIIGRWGDFFNRESFGEYTNSIFAMQLPLSSVRSSEVTSVMRENLETIGGISYIQVHPVFFYESLWCLLLLLLMLVWKRKKHFHGEVFLRYLAGYGLGRFVIEYFRTDKLMIPGTSVGVSQVISAALFLICAVVVTVEGSMAKKRAAKRRRRREQDYEAQERAAREAEAEEYRDRLRLERAFGEKKAGEVPEEYQGDTSVYHESSEEEPSEQVSEEVLQDDGQPDQTASEEISEEASEDELMEECEESEKAVENNVAAVEETAASKENPSLSEDDEWLYSEPRRFAKKPADEQEN